MSTKKNDASVETSTMRTTDREQYCCQYKILLKECAELLVDTRAELSELHYSIYQDDEIEEEDKEYDEIFQTLLDDGLEMIEKLKSLKILDSRR